MGRIRHNGQAFQGQDRLEGDSTLKIKILEGILLATRHGKWLSTSQQEGGHWLRQWIAGLKPTYQDPKNSTL
jgi:hypothetical protein